VRILANENIPEAVVEALRNTGHDVAWVKEAMPGADDRTILKEAQTERRIVLTPDLDFGELAFRFGLPAECGVVLVRLDWQNPETDNLAILTALTSREDWAGLFSVVERDRIRTRPISSSHLEQ
jgi:predicted nuclease of predicted toxin-antitoxin system